MVELVATVAGVGVTAVAAVLAYLQLARTPRPNPVPVVSRPETSRLRQNLPSGVDVVGRADETGRVLEGIASGHQVVALEGLGGMGKTTIALHCARQFADASVDSGFVAVVWVDDQAGRLTVNRVLDTITEVIDYPFIRALDSDGKLRAILDHLSGHRCLLVLDGLDTTDETALFRFIAQVAATTGVVLVTSRRQQVPGAWRIQVDGLPSDDAAAFLLGEAERLAVSMPFAGTDRAVVDLVAAVGGNPLAIKLAVGRLKRGSSVADVMRDLSRADYPDIFANIFDRIWVELAGDDHGRRALMAIALHNSPCTPRSVEAAVEISAAQLDAALERLHFACLTDAVLGPAPSESYVGTHSLTRVFVRDRLAREPELRAGIERRLLDHYLAYCVRHADAYGHVVNVQALELEQANIFYFLSVAYERAERTGEASDWRRVLRYADSLVQFLWGRGLRLEQLALSERAITAARAIGDGVAVTRQTCVMGRIHLWLNNTARAQQDLLAARAALPASATDVDRVAVVRLEAQIASADGDYARADRLLSQVLDIAPISVGDEGKAATLVELGISALGRGDVTVARSRFEEALRIDEIFGCVEGIGVSLAHLGDVLCELGDFDVAEEHYLRGLKCSKEVGRLTAVGRCSLGLARIALLRRMYPQARHYSEQAWGVFTRIGMAELAEEARIMAATTAHQQRTARRLAEVPAGAAYQLVHSSRAVIFDCDDTIVATAKNRWSVLIETAAGFDVRLEEADIREAWGLPFNLLIKTLVPAIPSDEFVSTYRLRMQEKAPELNRGSAELIGHLMADKVRLVILTSSSRDLVLQDLDALGIAKRFDHIYGYEQTEHHKPDPRVLDVPLRQLSQDGIKRHEIVYIGDSVRDYLVASGNDVDFVAVLTGLDERADFEEAMLSDNLIIDDLMKLVDHT